MNSGPLVGEATEINSGCCRVVDAGKFYFEGLWS